MSAVRAGGDAGEGGAARASRCASRCASRGALAAALLAASAGLAPLVAQAASAAPAPDVVRDSPPTARQAATAELRPAPGLTVELVAAEPLLQHPVALCVDDAGVVYVAETHRLHAGVTDIREHLDWLDDDLAARTVEDRLAYMRRRTGAAFDDYAAHSDRVRRLEDADGDGRFDAAVTFADGFDAHAAGIGAGLVAHDGALFYACIPSLWRLADTDGDGRADERAALSSGYGVRVSLLGHDLHGTIVGPDGRLWFSIGDRGLHVETPRGPLALPDQGAVLRCEPDGSDLALVHTGLRNPQELAFDDAGNLFTVDNNSDAGDAARLVQILPGADSGWRQPFQWLDDRGPWLAERWWSAEADDVFFRVPPLGHLASGPAGLAADPGGLLPAPFTDGLLLADFRGDAAASGVLGVQLEPRGAGFALGAVTPFVESVLVTDVAFDPAGDVLMSDWIEGWNHTGRGRLWRVRHDEPARAAEGARRAAELAVPAAERDDAALLAQLADPDRRLRQRAHLELARRPSAHAALGALAAGAGPWRPRWHALSALGVAARRHAPELRDGLARHTLDPAPELRGLALRLLGELAPTGAASYVLPRLADEHPAVRREAALAAAALGDPVFVDALAARLRAGDAEDPTLRHALSLALARCATPAALGALAEDEARDVRVSALLALRRLRDPGVARFLDDPLPELRAAAARAVWDAPVAAAFPALAARLDTPGPEPDPVVLRRALAAAEALGSPAEGARVVAFALRPQVPQDLRLLALQTLRDWDEPVTRDPVLGAWAPRPGHDGGWLPAAVAAVLRDREQPVESEPAALAGHWLALARRHAPRAAERVLRALVRSRAAPGSLRAQAFRDLQALRPADQSALVDHALGDRSARLRAAGVAALPGLGEAAVLEHLPSLLRAGTLPERRVALGLATLVESPRGEQLLLEQWAALDAGELPQELLFDLLAALPREPSEELLARRAALLGERDHVDLDGPLEALLHGGDPEAGRQIFERSALSCVRCHAREGGEQGDFFVGPSLDGVGRRLARRQLHESLRAPNARLAPGFLAEHLFLADGGLLTGRVLHENERVLVLLDAEGRRHELDPARVSERRAALSAMPEGLVDGLTPAELRDLIAYLAEL